MANSQPDKHTEVTAASFLRLAKAIRAIDAPFPALRDYGRKLARAFKEEARKLRAMR